MHGLDEFARPAVLLAIGDEEILQRDRAALLAPSQGQPRAERDEGRRRVADRRTVGDVAADRTHVAHLLAADAVEQRPQRRDALCQYRERLAVGRAGADGDDAVLLGNAAQSVQPADEDGRRDVAHVLGHPEPDIGRPGDDGGVRVLVQHGGEIVDRRRHDQPPVALADLDAPAVPERLQPGGHAFALGRQRILLGSAIARNRLCGAHDRLIAGAAAEIALQRLLDGRDGRIGRPHPQSVERHDEARRAEAALRAVEIDHRLLHGMQLASLAAQMFHRHHMAAVERTEKADAGIDAFIDEPARRKLAHQHGAGSAIALRAAFLGAAQVRRSLR